MWMTALVGMATKYAEVLLAVHYRERDEKGRFVGGPMYAIRNGLGPRWAWLGTTFALFGGLAGFGIGNMVQSNSIAAAMQGSFNIAPVVTGIVLSSIYRSAVERAFDRRLGVYLRTLVADVAAPDAGGGQRRQMGCGNLMIAVLDQVQMLDQEIAPPRPAAEQKLDLVGGGGINLAALRRRLGPLPSRSRSSLPASRNTPHTSPTAQPASSGTATFMKIVSGT